MNKLDEWTGRRLFNCPGLASFFLSSPMNIKRRQMDATLGIFSTLRRTAIVSMFFTTDQMSLHKIENEHVIGLLNGHRLMEHGGTLPILTYIRIMDGRRHYIELSVSVFLDLAQGTN